jgi:hypothetical protein
MPVILIKLACVYVCYACRLIRLNRGPHTLHGCYTVVTRFSLYCHTDVTILSHCWYTVDTMLLHRRHTIVSSVRACKRWLKWCLFARCCYTVDTMVLHRRYTVVALLSHYCVLSKSLQEVSEVGLVRTLSLKWDLSAS